MTTVRDDLDKRLAQLKREVPTRGFERHPSLLKNVSDLPGELQSPAVNTLANSEAIQTIIAFPSQIHRGSNYVPKQALLFTHTNLIHLMASIWPDQEPQITYLKGSGILYVKVTLVLLYGFLEIVAQGTDSPTLLNVEFNTVAWERLSPPLQQLLQVTKTLLSAPTEKDIYNPTMQQSLERLPLKFLNGVKIYGLLPGEELKELVFQPGSWRRWLILIRRPISANTLLLLTSNFMVVIQEDPMVGQGWIISYLPRNCIVGIQNQPGSLWNELTVLLKREQQIAEYKLLLKSEAVRAWKEGWLRHNSQWHDIPDKRENIT